MKPVHPRKVLTVLISEREDWFIDVISRVVHQALKPKCHLIALTPKTPDEYALFGTASRNKWDFAVLFLNNISYASGNRESRAIAIDSIDFVMKMAIVFHKPIVAVHGLTEGQWYHARLVEAGATAVYRVPFDMRNMVPDIRTCLQIS